ncbi:NUDIX hydrolase [Candidatus Falkowbacteria bacterium]|jgi:ADP-ribose pyrophosphatase|nr:NUDIX hydrolase [Candidatus Falkowbacteria bacterium]MBT7007655.1 NUDIX hydrolase [Candidatus Falkowbacteria bacterium]
MNEQIKEWEELSREVIFHKYSRKIEKVMYRLQDGQESDFYIKKEGPATAILAFTKDKKVILVKQYRPGPNEILHELPGGIVDQDESPEEAAQRELLEETGYQGLIRHVSHVYDCAYSTMKRYCVVIDECERVQEQNLDKTEFAEVSLISLMGFRDLLKSGRMTDVEVGYIGLDHLELL